MAEAGGVGRNGGGSVRKGPLVRAMLIGATLLLISAGQWFLVMAFAMGVLIGRIVARVLECRLTGYDDDDAREPAASSDAERR